MEKIKSVRIDCPMIKQEQENYKQLKNAIKHFEVLRGLRKSIDEEEQLNKLKNILKEYEI